MIALKFAKEKNFKMARHHALMTLSKKNVPPETRAFLDEKLQIWRKKGKNSY